MSKIPFKVSARAARLIGRENVSTAEAAIIELVKNSYDADATHCQIFFDNSVVISDELSVEDFDYALSVAPKPEVLSAAFERSETSGEYSLVVEDKRELREVRQQLRHAAKLWIIDDGHGMTDDVISGQWMVIGTDAKHLSPRTQKNRVKSGAKGIGRFALDKLGQECLMLTRPDPEKQAVHAWKVSWDAFEGSGKLIDTVEAELDYIDSKSASNNLGFSFDRTPKVIVDSFNEVPFRQGTVLEISKLRDDWGQKELRRLFTNLETLIPPSGDRPFAVSLYASSEPDSYGAVSASLCEDFDYKLEANFRADTSGEITITRNEIDLEKVPKHVFNRKALKSKPFDLDTMKRKSFSQKLTLEQLIPNSDNENWDEELRNIGAFKCTLFFMKRATNRKDSDKYFYKQFNPAKRKAWLDQFGGVKVYRDDFRVRPYGEPNSAAFDWLGLGERRYASPAAVSRSGAWRVAPQNIVGHIHISRLDNQAFQDKSSREGVQENDSFELFKQIIEAVIGRLENDRSYIASELFQYHKETNRRENNRSEAEATVSRLESAPEESRDPQLKVLTDEISYQKDEIDELREEQKLLRGLASVGTTIVSFAHELSALSNNLVDGVDLFEELLRDSISPDSYRGVPDFRNPFVVLKDIRSDEYKVKQWVEYSLDSVRKDKRKRKNRNVKEYFQGFSRRWKPILETRDGELNVEFLSDFDPVIRAFEIDLDSVFNNLVLNSVDAFMRKGARSQNRVIKITVSESQGMVHFRYEDSGPGLHKSIENPNDILTSFFTTKRDEKTGETTGTGIGMWLLKSVVSEHSGKVRVLRPTDGFAMEILLPQVKKRAKND